MTTLSEWLSWFKRQSSLALPWNASEDGRYHHSKPPVTISRETTVDLDIDVSRWMPSNVSDHYRADNWIADPWIVAPAPGASPIGCDGPPKTATKRDDSQ